MGVQEVPRRMVSLAGIEPATLTFGVLYSNPLSYKDLYRDRRGLNSRTSDRQSDCLTTGILPHFD